MNRPSLLVTVLAVAVSAAACTSAGGSSTPPASQPAPTGSAAAGACPTAPDPADLPDAWDPGAQSPTLIPLIVTNRIVCGDARIVFLFLDDDDQVRSAPERTASVAFYNLARDPETPVATADAEFTWAIEDSRGMYVVNAELPEAGIWGAEFTTEAPGAPAETIRMQFQVVDSSPTVQVGSKAPASDTPTLDDVGGDLAAISTDAEPVPAFYEQSVADALAAKQPFLLAFATPKFCTSAQCGPTLDRLKPVAEAHPEIAFINVEPYQLELAEGQLQPVLDANGQLTPAPATEEWGLLSEPWIFVVDGDGIVRGSFEGVVADAELERVLTEVTPAG
ncbi:MAG TPA: hypothetical protein VLA44_02770 [Clostridia bacterium]|nr:hypothetical protein [Clostridia bacterium]